MVIVWTNEDAHSFCTALHIKLPFPTFRRNTFTEPSNTSLHQDHQDQVPRTFHFFFSLLFLSVFLSHIFSCAACSVEAATLPEHFQIINGFREQGHRGAGLEIDKGVTAQILSDLRNFSSSAEPHMNSQKRLDVVIPTQHSTLRHAGRPAARTARRCRRQLAAEQVGECKPFASQAATLMNGQ